MIPDSNSLCRQIRPRNAEGNAQARVMRFLLPSFWTSPGSHATVARPISKRDQPEISLPRPAYRYLDLPHRSRGAVLEQAKTV